MESNRLKYCQAGAFSQAAKLKQNRGTTIFDYGREAFF